MKKTISLLSGPVMLSPKVSKAFAKPAISHRQLEFSQLLCEVQKKLQILTKAKSSTLMMGSGSLANEAIAANLSGLKNKTGLIISNGEFGERLIDQALRHNLKFKTIKENWGEAFDYDKIAAILLKNKIDWIWFVHCETSTGVMNDLEKITKIAQKTNTKICVDCMSSIGVYPLNLSQVYLASASSNKGLESFAGLGIVFYNHHPKPNKNIPKYLDLGFYHDQKNIPFTFSSNLLEALNASLDIVLKTNKFDKIKKLNNDLAKFLRRQKIAIIADKKSRSAAILTFKFSKPKQSEKLGEFLQSRGVFIHYKNHYLLSRNWAQAGFFSASNNHSHLNSFKKLVVEFLGIVK